MEPGRKASRHTLVRRALAAAAVATAPSLVAGSCSSSIHFLNPVVGKADQVADARIVGEWERADTASGDRWLVQLDSSNDTYHVVIAPPAAVRAFATVSGDPFKDDSATMARLRRDPQACARRARDSSIVVGLMDDGAGPHLFDAVLGRLGDAVVIDVAPTGLRPRQRLPGMRIDTRRFWRLDVRDAEVRLVPLSGRWLEAMLDSSRITLAHNAVGGLQDGTLVTASTAELRGVLAPFVHDTSAFRDTDAIVLRRPAARESRAPPARKP